MNTPAGFTMKICPLASSWPLISVGKSPNTRFSTRMFGFIKNSTTAPFGIPNEVKLMMAVCDPTWNCQLPPPRSVQVTLPFTRVGLVMLVELCACSASTSVSERMNAAVRCIH